MALPPPCRILACFLLQIAMPLRCIKRSRGCLLFCFGQRADVSRRDRVSPPQSLRGSCLERAKHGRLSRSPQRLPSPEGSRLSVKIPSVWNRGVTHYPTHLRRYNHRTVLACWPIAVVYRAPFYKRRGVRGIAAVSL